MNPSTFSIFLGDSKTMYMKALNYDCFGGDPLDLTNCSEIDVALPKADGTFSHRLLSTGQVVITQPPVLGNFSAIIPSVVSALLNVGQYQDFTVTFTILAEVFSVRFSQGLSVFET